MRLAPPKDPMLIVFTIAIIRRAVGIFGVCRANAPMLPTASLTWQSVQQYPSEAENIPITSMNSSTGTPLRTRMSLKASSDICGRAVCAAWLRAYERPARPTMTICTAPKIAPLHLTFIRFLLPCGVEEYGAFFRETERIQMRGLLNR